MPQESSIFDLGPNEVVGTDGAKIVAYAERILAGKWKKSCIPELWDGKASERIVGMLRDS